MAQDLHYAPNHVIDPATGFLESKAFPAAFDANMKVIFFERLKANGLRLYATAKELGISHHTINKHYQQDEQFRKIYDQLEREYADELEGVSRLNALNPKSVIERIFQLKALLPQKYADQRNQSSTNITIQVDSQLLSKVADRQNIIEAEEIPTDSIQTKDTFSLEDQHVSEIASDNKSYVSKQGKD